MSESPVNVTVFAGASLSVNINVPPSHAELLPSITLIFPEDFVSSVVDVTHVSVAPSYRNIELLDSPAGLTSTNSTSLVLFHVALFELTVVLESFQSALTAPTTASSSDTACMSTLSSQLALNVLTVVLASLQASFEPVTTTCVSSHPALTVDTTTKSCSLARDLMYAVFQLALVSDTTLTTLSSVSPSSDMSLPSTVPVTIMSPVTSTSLPAIKQPAYTLDHMLSGAPILYCLWLLGKI